jgi:hypothetical protein
MLNSCYHNTYFKAKLNKFIYFIYASEYDPKDLRFHYMISCLTTGAATVMLAAINPFLPLALDPIQNSMSRFKIIKVGKIISVKEFDVTNYLPATPSALVAITEWLKHERKSSREGTNINSGRRIFNK